MAEEKPTKHSKNFKDITGQRFGMYTVISFASRQNRRTKWLCACDCGNIRLVEGTNLRCGNSKGCGCLRDKSAGKNLVTHGMTKTRAYGAWISAKARCFYPGFIRRDRYADRGITMCEEWRNDFTAFFQHIGPCPDGYSLDRIDNEKGYEPGNVRWVNQSTQVRNRSKTILITHEGETLPLIEWAERLQIPYSRIYNRRRMGLPLFAPSRYRR